ncbi:MAG: MFS transporter [Gemmatales bacterium]
MNKPTPPLHRNVKLLGWASFFNDVASEMIAPLLPAFLLSIGAGKQAIGWIEGVADALASLLKLFAGAWSDRMTHRRGLIVAGYAMPALLRPLLGLTTSWWQVFLIRSGDRFGKGIRTSARDALIADSSSPDQRGYAFGFHRAMDHLGAALGPVLAFLFLWWMPDGVRTLMLLAIIPGIIVTLLVFVGLQEQPRVEKPKEPFRFQIKELGSKFWYYLLAIALFALGSSSDMFLLVRLKELGVVDEKFLLLLWCVFHLLKSYGNIFVGRLTDRLPPQRLLTLGWIVYALIYAGMAWVGTAWAGITLFLLYALYYALSEPPEKALVVKLVPAHLRGQAFGWFHFVTGIMLLPASVLFGYIYEAFGAWHAFTMGTILALSATVVLVMIRFDKEPDSPAA